MQSRAGVCSVFFASAVLLGSICACSQRYSTEQRNAAAPTRVIVVAPVLNLSGSADFEPLRVTDAVASECQSFAGVAVVPVNLVIAELLRAGLTSVESPEDAAWLAAVFGADGTLVTAVTEYAPYEPMRIGLVMQWYGRARGVAGATAHAAGAPEESARSAESGAAVPAGRFVQHQRVFDAARSSDKDEILAYAKQRTEHGSAYGAEVHVKSQELFVRYCSWACFRSIRSLLDEPTPEATARQADE